MDSIDIVDNQFSLGTHDIGGGVSSENISVDDSSLYLYIGIGVLVLFIGIFAYKYYMKNNTSREKNELDCEGGFCTMEKCPV